MARIPIQRVLISAAEASSDIHGAELLRRLKEIHPGMEAFGIGGPKLRVAGLDVLVDASSLLVMGFTEAIGKIFTLRKALNRLEAEARARRPDVVVVLDYPEFHFRAIRRFKKLGIPVIYYIPPKVWVWRFHRIRFLRKFVDKVLCILPFEEEMYRRSGVHSRYVGNPLVDELPMELTRAQAREKLGLNQSDRVIVLMPGSRPAELENHLMMMVEAAWRVAEETGQRFEVLVPLPLTENPERWRTEIGQRGEGVRFRLSQGDSALCLRAADAGLVKSGTSTLEAGLLECPHVVVFKASGLTHWIFRNLIRYRGAVGLVNLVGGWKREDPRFFREILMDEVAPDRLTRELKELLMDQSRLPAFRDAFRDLKNKVIQAESPSTVAAREVLSVRRRALRWTRRPPGAAVLFWFGSVVWSAINFVMRGLVALRLIRPMRLGSSRVISVGNLQAGGAGKTPLVAQIARDAIRRGKTVAILCRGYGGGWEQSGGILSPSELPPSTRESGDEAALLRDLVPEAWIGVGKDRVSAFRQIEERLGRSPDWVILDDGFQHWRIHRDIDVLAVTSMRNHEVLFRDFRFWARRADLIVWTKGEVEPKLPRKADVRVRFRLDRAAVGAGPVCLVTGLADGATAFETASDAGHEIARHVSFPDHARYAEPMVRKILETAEREGLTVVTTGKDWVKWREFETIRGRSVRVLEPKIEFETGEDRWSRVLWG